MVTRKRVSGRSKRITFARRKSGVQGTSRTSRLNRFDSSATFIELHSRLIGRNERKSEASIVMKKR